MKLFLMKLSSKIISNLKIVKTVSGGSVANSIVGLSQLEYSVGLLVKNPELITLEQNMKMG